jgi:hypothetical protein
MFQTALHSPDCPKTIFKIAVDLRKKEELNFNNKNINIIV